MNQVRSLWARIRAIQRRTWLFLLALLVVLVVATGATLYTWEYTNSPQFCGTTCHTMPPEYNAYQVSPHARVNCVECHLGRSQFANVFTRKAGDIMHVVRYSSNQYTFPLYASSMLPSRESCEKCHWPEKFSDDKYKGIKHYQTDEKNSLVTTLLVMRTGGGTERQGLGRGIHWHIENDVEFIALDPLKQQIPWVQVTDSNGKTTVYSDIAKPLTQDEIAKADKTRMDCIDCHNRISHTFKSPDKAVDEALTLRQIDDSIPFIKQKGVEVLSAKYTTFDQAYKAIDGLKDYYTKQQPTFYAKNAALIQIAIDKLKSIYDSLIFPTQDLSWTTHPDNIGHKDWPGCFRCHDGKHFTSDNKSAIRLECNVCHTLPQAALAGQPAPVVNPLPAQEPDSHLSTMWLAQHRSVFNATCQACHDTSNAGGKDNTSFCSNSACHGSQWKFAGLNAPALSKLFTSPVVPAPNPNAQPPKIPHPIGGSPDCQICHGPKSIVRPFPSDHTGRANETCMACHQPSIPPSGGTTAKAPPIIPHDLAGRAECLGCHGSGAGSIPQIPQFHKDYEFKNSACLTCHKTGVGAP
ncbi:MAG TPA: NapC/NirT family cytochrome c, partial [Anaerolineae bacterium]